MTNIPETIRSGMLNIFSQMSLVFPRIAIHHTPQIVQLETDISHSLFNRVITYNGATSLDAENAIQAIVDRYRARKVNFAWLTWSNDEKAAELVRQLEGIGLKRTGNMAGMWLSLSKWKHAVPEIPGFTIRPVQTEEDMAHFRQVVLPTFGFKGEAGEAFMHIQSASAKGQSAPFRHYLGSVKGQTVGAATAFYDGDRVGIYNISTLEAFRRKGIGAALTAHAVREGQAAGGSIAVLQASQMGLSVYRSLGFEVGVDIGIYTDVN